MSRIPDELIRKLRNDIPVLNVIQSLGIPAKLSEGYWRFQCPLCHEMQTAIHHKTNLARCFRCKLNFNPIDITIEVRKCSFVEACSRIAKLLP